MKTPRRLLLFFAALVCPGLFCTLLLAPAGFAAEETAPQSREFIFKQQALDFYAHDETPGGGYVLLGGGADATAVNFPVLAYVGKDGAVTGASIFTQSGTKKISETIGAPLWGGFGRLYPLGDHYTAAVALNWDEGGTPPRLGRELLLAVFDAGRHVRNFFKFEDKNSHDRIYLRPGAVLDGGKIAFLASRSKGGEITENFIAVLDDKLESGGTIPLPAGCAGALLHDPVNHRYITVPRQARAGRNICLVPEDGKDAKLFALHENFELDDAAVAPDGALVLAGKQQLMPPVFAGKRNRPAQIFRFDRDMNFLSGLEFSDVLDDLGNSLFPAPGGGWLLTAELRESPFTMQTRTAVIRLDDKLSVTWAALKDNSGPENAGSAVFRSDGALSLLVKLELYRQARPQEAHGRRVRSFTMLSSLSSFALLEFGKDGKEPGDLTTAYQPRTNTPPAEETKIFEPAGGPVAPLGIGPELLKTEVPLVETKTTLEPKALGRPWDDMREAEPQGAPAATP